MIAVDARTVQKTYGGPRDTLALQDISLEIPEGQFVSILGPSGCGKSTFLRCMAGLEEISDGSLSVQGRKVAGPPDNIGMVFQRDALLDWRTIERNIMLPIEFARKSTAQARPRMEELLKLTKLDGFADRYPRELSGGMRQRAAICRALIDSPEILLMDEPFGALDALTRDQMNVELQNLWMGVRNTVVFVTHGISEAVYLGDKVVVFSPRPGRILEVIDIDIPRPRKLAVRETREFGVYTQHIRDLFEKMGLFNDNVGEKP